MQKKCGSLFANYFFLTLLLFAASLPLSQVLVSISSGLILIVALVEDTWTNKIARFHQNKWLLLICSIYLIYLISAFISADFSNSFYDLRKTLFYFIVPIAFVFGKKLNRKQIEVLYKVFIVAVTIAIVIALVKWLMSDSKSVFYIHEVTFVDHIQFSFQLILAFWLSLSLYKNNKDSKRWFYLPAALFILAFLFLQQSLVGILSFLASLLYVLLYTIYQSNLKDKILIYWTLALILLLPVGYLTWAIYQFYDTEIIDEDSIDKNTKEGNPYSHNFNSKLIENGYYVNLYVNEEEMRREWNKRGTIAYDSLDACGYAIKSTLIRYMTSKGLRKDAEGVRQLSQQDIKNVENSIANIIYTKSKYSLYPRIYQTIWEYYIYSKTGNSNNKSFAQRIVFSQAAASIIKEHPFFGVGICCWKSAFVHQYQQRNPNFYEKYYASSHNQYLNYLVKFGIIGFLLIILLIFYPIIKIKLYQEPVFMVFFISLLVGNLGDSNFETHMAGAFFVFFYCFFFVKGNTT